jgi:chromosomal replication initiator protein
VSVSEITQGDTLLDGAGGETVQAAVIWSEVLQYLRTQVSAEAFATWLEPTTCRTLRGDLLEVEVPHQFFAEWLGHHYAAEIRSALSRLTGRDIDVSFVPANNVEAPVVVSRREPGHRAHIRADGLRLQARYTFDSFVVGESNHLATAAARNVAEQPSGSYNPLFIYGGVGLGKTHLVQAIGNHILGLRSGAKVHYTAAETLFIEFIQAIEKDTRLAFKNKYRALDVLLLDDVHYLIGKERLQEEVFFIFNSLRDAGSQVVFTCDRPPLELIGVENRLASRLGSGLVVDIQPPELETRVAILKQKAAAERFEIPADVACYVATRVKSSVRQLEACLVRLMAIASLAGRSITVELAAQSLKDIIREDRVADPKLIVAACASAYGLSPADLASGRRTKHVALARQVAMYLMRASLGLSLKEIGSYFGGKDHTTVMHGVAKVKDMKARDQSFAAHLEGLTKAISRG